MKGALGHSLGYTNKDFLSFRVAHMNDSKLNPVTKVHRV